LFSKQQALMRSSIFWDVTQYRLVVSKGCFGTTCLSHFQGSSWTAWPLKMGPISCPEMSITYQSTLCNIPEKGRSYLHHCGSLKSCNRQSCFSLCLQW
jgi:hypothetical protein